MKNLIAYFSVIAFVIGLIFGAGKLMAENKETSNKVNTMETRVSKVEDKVAQVKEKTDTNEIKTEAIKETTESIEKKQDKTDQKIDKVIELLLEQKQKEKIK